MSISKKEKGSGNGLSFLLSIVFFSLVILFIYLLQEYSYIGVERLWDISIFEFIILTLAVFRLQRLLVYDKVAQYIRDLWLDTKEIQKDGIVYIERKPPAKGFRRLMADLFGCPWCIGVWASLFTLGIYFLFPWTWYFWLLLAVAGASSYIQLSINMIGWKAEYGKVTTQAFVEDRNKKKK